MTLARAYQLTNWLPAYEPIGFTIDELGDLSEAIYGYRYWHVQASAQGVPLRFNGRPVVIIPDDWDA